MLKKHILLTRMEIEKGKNVERTSLNSISVLGSNNTDTTETYLFVCISLHNSGVTVISELDSHSNLSIAKIKASEAGRLPMRILRNTACIKENNVAAA